MSPQTSTSVLLRKPDCFLVALARRGSDAAFAVIVARYRARLQGHCSRFLSEARAEDAVQQSFIRALQALRAGTEVRELRPWLYRIATNVALAEVGKRGWDYDQLPEDEGGAPAGDQLEQRRQAREALGAVAALPDRQRTALIRSALHGHSPSLIAHDMGINEVAARQLVHRARASVRAAVGAVIPAPVLWLGRRTSSALTRLAPQSAVAPATPKLAAIVIAAAITAPVPVIASAQHSRPARPRTTASIPASGRSGSMTNAAPAASAPHSAAFSPRPSTHGAGGPVPASSSAAGAPAPPPRPITPPSVTASGPPPPPSNQPPPATGEQSSGQPSGDPSASTGGDPTSGGDPSAGGDPSSNGDPSPSPDPPPDPSGNPNSTPAGSVTPTSSETSQPAGKPASARQPINAAPTP
jgi:RNA polymerase sigma factor (sigma-70 family)